MEILFKQVKNKEKSSVSLFDSVGIERFYIKRLHYETDRKNISRKGHYHTGFEIHIIESGYQTYEIGGQSITVKGGELLVIFPLVSHISQGGDPTTRKYAITFSATENCPLLNVKEQTDDFFVGTISSELKENLEIIKGERQGKKAFFTKVIECRAVESVLNIFRIMGVNDEQSVVDQNEVDERVLLAKQYIRDNVLRPVTLPEVASYCCISTKQLTRLFKVWENKTVAEYVRKQRCLYIEKLLADRTVSLGEISEKMNFSSEYYFNTLFKKHSGMSPGAYRKTLLGSSDVR